MKRDFNVLCKFNKDQYLVKIVDSGSSLEVQWFGLVAFTAVALGSVLGKGTKILQASEHGLKKKKRKKIVFFISFPFMCVPFRPGN